MHKHLRRLDRIWIRDPVYFITTCTHDRQQRLTSGQVVSILIDEWRKARLRHGWMVGRYVVMPDHAHFFCAPEPVGKSLSDFIGAWKRWTSKRVNQHLGGHGRLWQEEFFDRVLRSNDSYNQKWHYVMENPARAGLISSAEDWPWQGEIEILRI